MTVAGIAPKLGQLVDAVNPVVQVVMRIDDFAIRIDDVLAHKGEPVVMVSHWRGHRADSVPQSSTGARMR